jgi:hypothetical protein
MERKRAMENEIKKNEVRTKKEKKIYAIMKCGRVQVKDGETTNDLHDRLRSRIRAHGATFLAASCAHCRPYSATKVGSGQPHAHRLCVPQAVLRTQPQVSSSHPKCTLGQSVSLCERKSMDRLLSKRSRRRAGPQRARPRPLGRRASESQ